ncbi:MAG TPA: hypothetical protein VMW32_12350 [Bacteroidales bacterium]|nr:hypothetical protein [Bacteroidales bacterium]
MPKKTQQIRVDEVPFHIHMDVQYWAKQNKMNGKPADDQQKMYVEIIKLGHSAMKRQMTG